MKAIVLAGGQGKRLRPLTDFTPKPMLKVAGRPILDYVTAQLAAYSIDGIIYALGYLSEQIENHVRNYRGVSASCVIEKQPLGTCGSVVEASDNLDDSFIVASGDCISDIDLFDMVRTHVKYGAEATIAVTEVNNPTLYGVVTEQSGRITEFHEKPSDDRYGNLVNAGIYIFNKSALNNVQKGGFVDFSNDLFPELVKKGSLYAYKHKGYWSDVGDFDSLRAANRKFSSERFRFFVETDNKNEQTTIHLPVKGSV